MTRQLRKILEHSTYLDKYQVSPYTFVQYFSQRPPPKTQVIPRTKRTTTKTKTKTITNTTTGPQVHTYGPLETPSYIIYSIKIRNPISSGKVTKKDSSTLHELGQLTNVSVHYCTALACQPQNAQYG